MGNERSSGPGDRIIGLLGLARRAGKITFGFDAVLNDIRSGKAKAVFFSNDASPRTQKKVLAVCEECGTAPTVLPFDKETLGRAIGRSETAVAAVLDSGFAGRIHDLAHSD